MTSLSDLTSRMRAAGTLSAEDTLAFRRIAWPDGRIDRTEADAIFDANDAASAAVSREWIDFFVEAMSEYVVGQASPEGYVEEPTAAWFVERIARDGKVETLAELEALVRVLEKAANAPESLKAFALAEIERVVLTGEGPTRRDGAIEPGRVTAEEAALLRRVVFASGGDGPAIVSRAEADLLFRIKDASLTADNAPEWKRLFVQGVANHLMAHHGHDPLSRERAAQLERFMDDTRSSVLGFVARMGRPDFTAAVNAIDGEERDDHDAEVARDAAVTSGEQQWLDARVEAQVDDYEAALIAFLDEERAAG